MLSRTLVYLILLNLNVILSGNSCFLRRVGLFACGHYTPLCFSAGPLRAQAPVFGSGDVCWLWDVSQTSLGSVSHKGIILKFLGRVREAWMWEDSFLLLSLPRSAPYCLT